MIFKESCLTKGACGSSHMDADQSRQILASTKYKKEDKDLTDQIAILARKLASEIIDANSFEACNFPDDPIEQKFEKRSWCKAYWSWQSTQIHYEKSYWLDFKILFPRGICMVALQNVQVLCL